MKDYKTMVTEEFKLDIIRMLESIIYNIKASVDNDENMMLLGILSNISDRFREFAYERLDDDKKGQFGSP